MTLLDATALLIEIAKTRGPDDRLTRQAVRRMEQRLELLQQRKEKALTHRRATAWNIYISARPDRKCPVCGFEMSALEFVRTAVIDGRGFPRLVACPACHEQIWRDLTGKPVEELPEGTLVDYYRNPKTWTPA